MATYEIEAVLVPDPDGGPDPVLKLAVPNPLDMPGTVRYFTRIANATGVKVRFDPGEGSPFLDENNKPRATVVSHNDPNEALSLEVPGNFFAHCFLVPQGSGPTEEYGGNHVVR